MGQAVSDKIDLRHKSIIPDYIWGNGDPEAVRQRAAKEMINTAEAAKRVGVKISPKSIMINVFMACSFLIYL